MSRIVFFMCVLAWATCLNAQNYEVYVSYDIPSLMLSGEIPVRRIANDNVALCEALQ
jgi:hypothetical protein